MRDNTLPACIIALCCVFAAAGSTRAQQADLVSMKLDMACVSKYVWRGIVSNPDPALQPSLTLTHTSGISLNLWASIDGTGASGRQGRPTEVDYTANYAWTEGPIGMNAGLIGYTFPNTAFPSTKEIYASASFGGPMSPSLSVNYDFDQAGGCYISLSGARACVLKTEQPAAYLSARLSYATASYNKLYFGAAKSAFTDLLLTMGMPITVGRAFAVTPALSYSTVLDGRLRDGVADPDSFFTSVTASVAF